MWYDFHFGVHEAHLQALLLPKASKYLSVQPGWPKGSESTCEEDLISPLPLLGPFVHP